MGRERKRRPIAYPPQALEELSDSWAQTYYAEQAGKAGLNAEQHRQAAEDRERQRREANGSGPATTT